jgi:hypothetical protein
MNMPAGLLAWVQAARAHLSDLSGSQALILCGRRDQHCGGRLAAGCSRQSLTGWRHAEGAAMSGRAF